MTKRLAPLLAAVLLFGCADEPAPVDLWTPAATGDIPALEAALATGADIDAVDPNGASPLIIAAFFGQSETVEFLADRGADLGATNADGATALHVAAFFCRLESARALLEAGADPKAVNSRGETPLFTVEAEWSPMLAAIYGAIGSALDVEIDLDEMQRVRPEMADLLRQYE